MPLTSLEGESFDSNFHTILIPIITPLLWDMEEGCEAAKRSHWYSKVVGTIDDALPSPLLDPSWVLVNQTVELFGTQGTFLAFNTKKG
jgi:hypothetical protein